MQPRSPLPLVLGLFALAGVALLLLQPAQPQPNGPLCPGPNCPRPYPPQPSPCPGPGPCPRPQPQPKPWADLEAGAVAPYDPYAPAAGRAVVDGRRHDGEELSADLPGLEQ